MTRVDEALAKAHILTEALPYIRRWTGKTVVVKVGGEAIDDEESLQDFATDLVMMRIVGLNPVVVHGGGPQISAEMQRAGKTPVFADGQRYTDSETMEIVKRVLVGKINARIVDAMKGKGGQAAGISGEDGGLLSVRRTKGPDGQDLGFVGEVDRVDPGIVNGLIQKETIPVVAPIGGGPDGSYNVNADLAAGALAAQIGAEKIVFLTNVPGLYRDLGDEGSLISEIGVDQLEKLLDAGGLSEGMIPKIRSAVDAVRAGVPHAHILDGRIRHALLIEIFTVEGIGTMVLP
jgi:acetylglutamate kinase